MEQILDDNKADHYLRADFVECMMVHKGELAQWQRLMVSYDIPYRVNTYVPGTFVDAPIVNKPNLVEVEMDLVKNDEVEEQEEVKRNDYRPTTRFVKILKSLATKADVELLDEEMNILTHTYEIVAGEQGNMEGSLLNIYYVIYKLTGLIEDSDTAKKIRALVNLPKSRRLIQYDKRWKQIVSSIEWVQYKPTDIYDDVVFTPHVSEKFVSVI